MITQKEINRYIKDIKKELLYSSKQSREFLAQLRQNICDFAAENENADMSQITEQFGKPEDIAATFFEQYDKNEIKRKVNVRRVIVAAVVVVVLIFTISMGTIVIDTHGETHGYVIESNAKYITKIQNTDALN